MKNFETYVDFNNYKKREFKKYTTIFSFLTLVIYIPLCIIIPYDEYPFSLRLSSLILNLSITLVYWVLLLTFIKHNQLSLTQFDQQYFRVKWHGICIAFIAISIPSTFIGIGTIARTYALGIADVLPFWFRIVLFIPCIADIIGKSLAIYYICHWFSVLRWEYEELNLSHSEKIAILKKEKLAYKQLLTKGKQARKDKELIARDKRKQRTKQNISNIKTNIIAKFKSINTQTNSQTVKNTPISKLDKLNELKELHDNGVISDEEYQKARADILGK